MVDNYVMDLNNEEEFIHDLLNALSIVEGKLDRIDRKLNDSSYELSNDELQDMIDKAKRGNERAMSATQKRRTYLQSLENES